MPCKKQPGRKKPRLLTVNINFWRELGYNKSMKTGTQHLYFGWNVIKRRIWGLWCHLPNAMELLSTGNLEEQQFLLRRTKVSKTSAKYTNPTARKLFRAPSVQISTCLRVLFSWRSSWFFSQNSLIFSSSSSCLQDKMESVGLHGGGSTSLRQIFLFWSVLQHQKGFFVFSIRRSALMSRSGKSLVLLPCFRCDTTNTDRSWSFQSDHLIPKIVCF